jgi:hypothetical protein
LNPGHHGGKPATNRFSYGAAQHGTFANILYDGKTTTSGALKNVMDTDVFKMSGTSLGFLLTFSLNVKNNALDLRFSGQ